MAALFIVLLLSAHQGYGQQNEIGFGIGAFNYTGDLARNPQLGNFRPGLSVLYRRNLNDHISLRAGLNGGGIYGDDTPPFDVAASRRDTSFSRGIVELSSVIEYHFLNHRKNIKILRWSPYFFIGGGVAFLGRTQEQTEDYSNLQLVLPFGLGFKYVVNPRWTLALEGGVRKTFTDYLDDISGGDLRLKNYAYGNRHDTDWYYFLGLSLSYTFYTIPCPYQFN